MPREAGVTSCQGLDMVAREIGPRNGEKMSDVRRSKSMLRTRPARGRLGVRGDQVRTTGIQKRLGMSLGTQEQGIDQHGW